MWSLTCFFKWEEPHVRLIFVLSRDNNHLSVAQIGTGKFRPLQPA